MKKTIILLIIIILLIGGYIIYNYNISNLSKLGYSESEVSLINKNVKNVSLIEEFGYDKNIVDLISSNNYKDSNLEKYLDYYSKNNDADINDIIIIVNSGYNILNIKYNKITSSLVKEKYFIEDYLQRYIKYYDGKNDSKEIIKCVNSNIDYKFYTHTKKTDIKKDTLMLVNKFYYLDKNYEADDLVEMNSKYNSGINNKMRKVAYEAFKEMADDASEKNLSIKNVSAYRSYNYQLNLYNNYKARDGLIAADSYSARAGSSEHQTGLASDINMASDDFKYTDEFKWLKDNSYRYGFILRYPEGKEYITGYNAESWHYRYVGKKAAEIIYKEKITYEEYYAYYVLKKS